VHALGLEKPVLMGHSMGANTVFQAGARYPQLARRSFWKTAVPRTG